MGAALLIFIVFLLSGESTRALWKIDLSDGRTVVSDSVRIDEGQVILEDTVVSRNAVRSIFRIEERKPEEKGIQDDIRIVLEEGLRLQAKFPDAGGLILADHGEMVLHEDGTHTYRYHFAAKILKTSTKTWANVGIHFEEERSRITVDLARTIKPDGTVYSVSPDAIKVIKPKSDMVFFERDKSVQFELPDVSVGDIVEYRYSEEVFNPWNKEIFNFGYYFQTREPVGSSSLVVGIPDRLSLTYGTRNMDTPSPQVWEADGYRYYQWAMHEVEPVIEEPLMPPIAEVVPRVEVSTLESWDAIFDWYRDFQVARMVVTEEIQGLAEELVEGAHTDEERLARLYHFVQTNVRYISIKGGAASSVSGHLALETLEKGYGDCTDKAILFATLLKAVGIKAYPVYVGTNDEIPTLMTEVPSYYGNHCINEIEIDSSTVYLDATGETSRYPSFWSADHDVYAVNAIKRTVQRIPVPDPSENARTYEYQITVSSRDCEVTFVAHYSGDYEDAVRWHYQHRSEEETRQIMEEMIHEITPYSELIDYSLENLHDISQPFGMVLRYRLRNYLKKAGDLLLLELPDLSGRYTFDEVSLTERRYPVSYSTSARITHSYSIKLPGNLTIVYVPRVLHLTHYTHDGELCADYSAAFTTGENVVDFTDDLKRYRRVIPVSSYHDYKDLVDRISVFAKEKMVFEERTE